MASFCLVLSACSSARADGPITLQASGMSFGQEVVKVKVGQPVTVQLVNRDAFAHSFDIDEFEIHSPLAGKETLAVTFTPDKAGSYEFYCGAPGHRAAGMVGTVIVEP